ncbi:hypothetical protein Tco_0425587 [Tanacetum coccineum]
MCVLSAASGSVSNASLRQPATSGGNITYEVVSTHANEQFKIVCWDTLATQLIEPEKKKRKVTPKIESGPMVKNEVTERFQKFIKSDDTNGLELKLDMRDSKQHQNKLSLPFNKISTC